MKKIMLLVALAMMQTQWSAAQVDMSILKKPTLWANNGVDMDFHTAVYFNNGLFYRYSDGNIPKDRAASKNKYMRKPHLSTEVFCFFDGEYEIIGNKIKSPHSYYYWNITKLTKDVLILERGKRFSNDESLYDRDWVLKYKFKRVRNVKNGKYPLFQGMSGSMDAAAFKLNDNPYSGNVYIQNNY